MFRVLRLAVGAAARFLLKAIPHNSKYRYGERGAADAKPKAQIILDAAKVSAASGGCSEPKQGQRSQSARGFCPRSTMRVPQPDIIEHFGNADAVPQPPGRCLSRKAGIVRCCLRFFRAFTLYYDLTLTLIAKMKSIFHRTPSGYFTFRQQRFFMHPRVFVIFRGEISGPLWGIAPLLWARHIAHFYCSFRVGFGGVG